MYEAAKKPAWTWDFLSTPAYKYANNISMKKNIHISMRLSDKLTNTKIQEVSSNSTFCDFCQSVYQMSGMH